MFKKSLCLMVFFSIFGGFLFGQSLGGGVVQIFEAGIDTDDNPNTGCSYTADGETFVGIDILLVTTVMSVNGEPMVTQVEARRCQGGNLDGLAFVDSDGWPVGLNNGIAGSDVVETYIPYHLLGVTGRIRLVFRSESSIGGSDAITQTDTGGPIIYNFAIPTPTLTAWGMAAFLILLALAALWVIRRDRKRGSGGPTSLLVLGGIFLVGLVGALVPDGQVDDWVGQAPIAGDSQGDAGGDDSVDMLAAYVCEDGSSTRLYMRFDVVDLENAPPVADDVAVTLDEDGNLPITMTATDVNGDTLTFSIMSGPSNGSLSPITPLGPNSADVTYTPNADYFGPDQFTFMVDDGNGTSDIGTVDITVDPVNDEPSFTGGPDISGTKDQGPQSIPGWATAISAGPANESGQSLTFMVTNDNNALFSQQPAVSPTGTLTYTTADDSNGSAQVTVVMMDDGGTANGGDDTTDPQMFTISATAVNDAPSFTGGGNVNALEDDGPVTVSAWATAITPGPPDEAGQNLTFMVTDNTNAGLFAAAPVVDEATGDLTFTSVADAFGSADITLVLMDDGGTADGGEDTSDPLVFTIDVGSVNDAPSFMAGPDQAVLEDAGPQKRLVAWATAVSSGPANESGQLLTFNITNNTNPGLFSAGPIINPDGSLNYTPAADTSGSATLTIELMDDGGTANGGVDTSPAVMFDIDVTTVNDEPGFMAGSDETILEDAGAQTVPAWATAISAGPADESGQMLTFNITGNTNPGLFSAGPSVDPSSGDLTYTPATDANGASTITLELMDDGGTANGGDDTSALVSFTINVTAVNDEPVFTSGGNVTYIGAAAPQTEAGWATGISAGPADESGQMLTFNVTGNTMPGLFAVLPAVDPASGDLTYTPAMSMSGSATITLALMDDGGTANGGDDLSPAIMFDINITAQNQEPSFTAGSDVTVDEDSGMTTSAGWATNIDDGDGGSQILTFNITNNTNAGLFSAGPAVDPASGDLTFTLTADEFGTATITLELMDDGGTMGGGDDTSPPVMFDIIVNAVNDEPSFTAGADETVLEDAGPQTVMNWATAITMGPANESGQMPTFNITNNTNPALFVTLPAIDAMGTLTYESAANTFGNATITVELMDDGGTANGGDDTSPPVMFDITVTPVTDDPVADDETYSTVGNVHLVVQAATPSRPHFDSNLDGVLVGDSDPIEMTTISIVELQGMLIGAFPFTQPSGMGGEVTIFADGSFTYTPPAGITGVTDTFTYTIENTGGGQDMGTVSLDLTDLVWFVDSSFGGTPDGRSITPHTDFSSLNGAGGAGDDDDVGHIIYVHQGAGTYGGGLELEDNQQLTGEGASITVTDSNNGMHTFTLVAGTAPDLGNGAGHVITLANGNTVEGVNLLPTASAGIFGNGVAGGTITNVTADPTGTSDGLMLTGCNGTFNIDMDVAATVASSGIGAAVDTSSGTFTFSGFSSGNMGTGVSLLDNTMATFSFTGTTTLSGHSVGGININSGAAATDPNITVDLLSLNSSAGTAIVVMDHNGSFGVTGGSITHSGGRAINFDNFDGGSNLSGLTAIDNSNGDGVRVNNSASGFTFPTLTITNPSANGIELTGNTGSFTFNNTTVNGSPTAGVLQNGGDSTTSFTQLNITSTAGIAINAANSTGAFNVAGGTITHSGGRFLDFDNMDGGGDLSGATISGAGLGVEVTNSDGAFTFSNITVNSVSASNGIHLDSNGTASFTFSNLDLTTDGSTGLFANNSGTLSWAGTSTISANNGLGVDVTNSAFGGGGQTLADVTVTGNAGGIDLDTNTGTLTVADLDINVTGAPGVRAVGGGTLNLDPAMANNAPVSATGFPALHFDGMALNVDLGNVNATTSATNGVRINACTGDFDVGPTTVTSTNEGVFLTGNTGGTFTFGSVGITTTAGRGLVAEGGGLLEVDPGAVNTNTISATGGEALDVDATGINLNLDTVTSTNSTSQGIDLTNIPGGGTLTVTGTTTVNNAAATGPVFSSGAINIVTVAAGTNIGFGTTNINNRNETGIFVDNHDGMSLGFGNTDIFNPNNAGGYGIRIQNSAAPVSFTSADIRDTNETVAETDLADEPTNEGDGDGIFLVNNSGGFTLNGGTIEDTDGQAFDGRQVQGLMLNSVTMQRPASHAMRVIDITGNNMITGCTFTEIDSSGTSGVLLINNTGTLGSTTVDNTDFTDCDSSSTMLRIEGRSASDMDLTVQNNCMFTNLFGAAITHVAGFSAGTANVDLIVRDAMFLDAKPNGNGTLVSQNLFGATSTILIEDNIFDNVLRTLSTNSGVINVNVLNTATVNNLTIHGNTINDIGDSVGGRGIQVFVDNSPSIPNDIIIDENTIDDLQRSGIFVDIASTGVTNHAQITDNIIGQTTPVGQRTTGQQAGIEVFKRRAGGGTSNVLVDNNMVRNQNTSALRVTFFVNSEDNTTLNLTATNNDFTNAGGDNTVLLEAFDTSTLCMVYTGNDQDDGTTGAVNDGDMETFEDAGATFTINDLANITTNNNGNVFLIDGGITSGGVCPVP